LYPFCVCAGIKFGFGRMALEVAVQWNGWPTLMAVR
jgi:hypothetical protein